MYSLSSFCVCGSVLRIGIAEDQAGSNLIIRSREDHYELNCANSLITFLWINFLKLQLRIPPFCHRTDIHQDKHQTCSLVSSVNHNDLDLVLYTLWYIFQQYYLCWTSNLPTRSWNMDNSKCLTSLYLYHLIFIFII